MDKHTWFPLGPLAITFDLETGAAGLGIRFSWRDPAFDLFVGPVMIGVTTRKHAEWIDEQIEAYHEPLE